jgi:O-antigen/teichoic acid export membrane protein
VAMACCGWLLYLAVRGISREDVARASEAERINPAGLEPTVEAEGDPVTGVALATDTDDEQFEKSPSIFGHVIRFGLVALISALIWQAAENVSYLMIYVWFGSEYAGPYHVFIRFSQPLLFISNAAWAVLYTHIARRWEADDRDGAMFVFETSYKAIGLATMSLTVLIYITSPWWSQILDVRYQVGRYYLPGLLTFFMTICNLSLLVVLTKLHERPGVIALAALAGAAANVILAALWMPVWGEVGAARAAGVGIYFGGGLVMLVYLLASNTRLQDSTYFILGTPILLLLPRWIIGPLWAVVLPVCLFSSWVFNARQRNALAHTARRSWHAFMELRPWQR